MTTICLVRHGETDWNVIGKLQGRTDIPLNARGISQAEECRDYLKAYDWDIVVTSPLMRARKTAEIINEGIQASFVVMEEFQEKSFGEAEGMTAEERQATFPNHNYTSQEDTTVFHQRLIKGLSKINELYQDQKVLLVAHGAVIHALLKLLSDGNPEIERTPLFNACISNLHFKEEKWQIKDYNQVAHLSEYHNPLNKL
ncbi:putative phosphatase [Bacillus mesophilus]|uniref:Histidine phosphatase family protein n=1 Tax=Bacillus mesophilus TaxID=1808955 RepID=A0A6M0Q4G4_9BACI|nr:histidine phosphatase family protein [Bacillus mesophilus]MBM7661198.1 putative phosphatase [Bacillus mesophilus]NEY71276.1 histidine phosphatase family protein [Bacillus mesophilus]